MSASERVTDVKVKLSGALTTVRFYLLTIVYPQGSDGGPITDSDAVRGTKVT